MAESVTVPLGLGAANLGNLYRAMSDDEAAAVLETAWSCGVRAFDTAPHYGLGLSEVRLGAFLRGKPRAEFTVSTKVGRLLRPDPGWTGGLDDAHDFVVPARLRREWDFSAEGVLRSLEESLERLGLDHVDAVYLHDPERHDLARGLDEGLSSLVALREQGLVAEVGVGSMDVDALAAFARTGAVDRLMVAGRYTLADQSAADDVLPACHENNVRVVAAAVFNSGLLATDRPRPDSLFDYASTPAEVLDRVNHIAAVCREHDVALPVAALHFPLRDPAVVGVVAGAATPDQARANAAALQTVLPEDLWAALQTEGLVR
jgi:D-threo-aldose 1-dehydrogenase